MYIAKQKEFFCAETAKEQTNRELFCKSKVLISRSWYYVLESSSLKCIILFLQSPICFIIVTFFSFSLRSFLIIFKIKLLGCLMSRLFLWPSYKNRNEFSLKAGMVIQNISNKDSLRTKIVGKLRVIYNHMQWSKIHFRENITFWKSTWDLLHENAFSITNICSII